MALLTEKNEEPYTIYADPTQSTYKALGMVNTLTNPESEPGYITTGYWSKVAAGTSSHPFPSPLPSVFVTKRRMPIADTFC